MSEQREISVPDDAGVFLAISASNYADADMAFWSLKDRLGKTLPGPAEQAHLDQLRQRRKETYADLVVWVMSVEAQRLGVAGVEVTPVTPAPVECQSCKRDLTYPGKPGHECGA